MRVYTSSTYVRTCVCGPRCMQCMHGGVRGPGKVCSVVQGSAWRPASCCCCFCCLVLVRIARALQTRREHTPSPPGTTLSGRTTLHTLFLSPSLTFPVTDIYVHFLCPPLRVSLSRNRPAGEERERQNYWGTKRALRHCTAVRALGTAATESEAPTPSAPLALSVAATISSFPTMPPACTVAPPPPPSFFSYLSQY